MADPQLALPLAPERPQKSPTIRDAVLAILLEGGTWGLRELRQEVVRRRGKDCSETSISAKLRDLRKPSCGGYDVRARHVASGVWVYWIGGQG